ncbi:MAG: amino acid adenylation domain-containing protein [Verrucomicrobiota bacterium]
MLQAHLQVPLAPLAIPDGLRPDTLLRAAWALVLSRHTSTRDVTFYTSFHDEEPWVAPFRVVVPPKTPAVDWLALVEEQLQAAEAAGPLPTQFAAAAREEGLDRTAPAFIVVHPGAATFPPRDQLRGPLLAIARLDIGALELHYDSAWFDAVDIRALGEHLSVVLAALGETPQAPVGWLPILTGEERLRVLEEWNDTTEPFAETTCVHQFFEEQVRRTPDAVAIIFCDKQWTYRELNAQAEALAHRLRDLGVGRGTFVAVCVNRSLELMATLLAVLKAGGAYVPLDPAYPPERLAFMVEDAQPAVVAVSRLTAPSFAGSPHRLFLVDERVETNETAEAAAPLATPSESSDAAYVLYTSGSTGKPKGVVVTHRNVSNFFTAMDGVIGPEPGVWLAVTSVNFDISVFELFWTLARGFRIVLQEEGQWVSATDSAYALPQQMRRHGVTHLQCTPSLASMLILDPESVRAIHQLRRFMVGGEPLPLDLARRLTEIISGELYNLYGPTETTVWSAAQLVPKDPQQILIGRPVANNRLYVLDAERELVPIGSVGELYIGGDGLAREYLRRPDITAERFVEHTFPSGRRERLYRTGDLVRQQRDGRLEFMGRTDFQIKIRGVRVELGEIEMIMRQHPDIRDAVVLAVEDESKDKRLVAYAIPAGAAPAVPALQQWLGTKLPKVIVPSAILFLPEFPKTPNGKLDRRALPRPDQKASAAAGGGSELDRLVAAIWSEVLGVSAVGPDDRFFDLGGNALLMNEVHDKLRERAGHAIPLLDLFQFPTVRLLANHLRDQTKDALERRTATGRLRGLLRQQAVALLGPAVKNPSAAPSS